MTLSIIKTTTTYYYESGETTSSSVILDSAVIDNSVEYVTDKEGNQVVSKVSCGFYNCLVGDPRIKVVREPDTTIITTTTDSETGADINVKKTTTTYSYHMSYESDQRNYYNKNT